MGEKRVVLQYDALGQFTLIRRYNDLDGQAGDLVAESAFVYDALARLVGLEHDYNGGSIASAWQYDAAGRIVSFVSPEGTIECTGESHERRGSTPPVPMTDSSSSPCPQTAGRPAP